uniref:Phage-related protein n=1 Tax=uncultured bacterium contig00034 TaxID=1181523 RepID=A0A806KC26_9BACT|nr:phage-related protein [uncultured bacterium contig00034]
MITSLHNMSQKGIHMYEVIFYKDGAGRQPVKEYLEALSKRTDKDGRINYGKINDYITLLKKYGLSLREPYIKHLDGDIWELRPLNNRVLFFGHNGKEFVLLHHFIKKTKKTPQAEIDRAKRNMRDFIERGGGK